MGWGVLRKARVKEECGTVMLRGHEVKWRGAQSYSASWGGRAKLLEEFLGCRRVAWSCLGTWVGRAKFVLRLQFWLFL